MRTRNEPRPHAHPRLRGAFTVRAAPLTDTHVLVTGAGRGIGRALAIACCHGGAAVSLVARTALAEEWDDPPNGPFPSPMSVIWTGG